MLNSIKIFKDLSIQSTCGNNYIAFFILGLVDVFAVETKCRS